jgi:hypothetical protein
VAAVIGALRAELSAGIGQFIADMGKGATAVLGFSKTAKSVARDLDSTGKAMSISITAPFLLLSKASIDAAKNLRTAQGQISAALVSTGDASGKSAEGLERNAKALSSISIFDKSDILKNVSAQLLTFGNVTGGVFDRAQALIVDMASRMGGGEGSLEDATMKWGKALNDPIQGTKTLTRAGIQFTTAEQLQVKWLVQHGRALDAQNILLDAGIKKFGGAAIALRKAQPDAAMQSQWTEFEETIGNIEIKLLPALTDELKSVLEWFQKLSPQTQQNIVEFGIFAAAMGPVLVGLSTMIKIMTSTVTGIIDLVKWIAGLEIGIVALSVTVLAVAAALGVLAAAIYYSRTISAQATTAIDAQTSAHKFLEDAMIKAAQAGRNMTAEERDAAAQKLKLAQNTLKAALAQEQQNLAEAKSQQSGGLFSTAANDVKNLLQGKAPPEIAQVRAQNAIKQLQDQLAGNAADQAGLFGSSAVPGGAVGGKGGGFDLHNADEIKKAVDALKELEKNLTTVQQRIATGLEEVDMPKSITDAKQLNDQLDNYLKAAQQAGANTGAFAGRVQALRDQIEKLKQAELAKEAAKFAIEVNKDQQAVDEFAKGGLTPLQQKLQSVDDDYQSLKDKIEDQIKSNQGLADANTDAAATMDKLKAKLAALELAHKNARDAATAQAKAEELLADLQAKSSNLDTAIAIRDLKQSSGAAPAPISSAMEQLQAETDDLAKKQIAAAEAVAQDQADLAKAQQEGYTEEIARAQSKLELAKEYQDLVGKTTAEQIDATTKINEAWKSFSDSLSQDLSDMIVKGNWSFTKIFDDLEQLGEKLFVKPFMDQVTSILSNLLKSLTNSFAGGFAGGGGFGPNQWALVGENGPELISSGNSQLNVMSNPDARSAFGSGGGVVFNQYVTTPNPGAFMYSRRQLARQAKQAMGS